MNAEEAQDALRDMSFLEDQLKGNREGLPITMVRTATGVAVKLPGNSVMACGDNLRDALHILQLGLGDGT